MRILTVPKDMTMLRSKSQPVEKIDAELLVFLKELGETLKRQKDPQGIGLSAVQVGRPIRIFATLLPRAKTGVRNQESGISKEKPQLVYYVNPEIVSHPNEMTLGEDLIEDNAQRSCPTSHGRSPGGRATINARPFLEGCLSIPDIYGPVLRWPWIKATAAAFSEKDLLDISLQQRSDLCLIDISLNDLGGRVFQHELDHLNGILFTDHVLAQGNKLYRDLGDGPEQINL